MICQHCDKAEVRPGRECAWCGRVAEQGVWVHVLSEMEGELVGLMGPLHINRTDIARMVKRAELPMAVTLPPGDAITGQPTRAEMWCDRLEQRGGELWAHCDRPMPDRYKWVTCAMFMDPHDMRHPTEIAALYLTNSKMPPEEPSQ